MAIGTKFSENRDIDAKNGNRLKTKGFHDKSLIPYIRGRGFLNVRKQITPIYYNCKKCGDKLSNNALRVSGICMCCENG